MDRRRGGACRPGARLTVLEFIGAYLSCGAVLGTGLAVLALREADESDYGLQKSSAVAMWLTIVAWPGVLAFVLALPFRRKKKPDNLAE